MDNYLTDLPSDICNSTGLAKTLITRRETIRLKHLQKNLFVYNMYGSEELCKRLEYLQFRGLMKYFEFLTNRLRGIYKITRDFTCEDVNLIVKENRCSFIDMVRMYKAARPIVVIDFDKTLTNPKFHRLYQWLRSEKIKVIINTANPSQEVVEGYLLKHDLVRPSKIINNKGKQKKLVSLKHLAINNPDRPMFYLDDELEYIEYANLLFYMSYLYTKQGKILYRTLNVK